MACAMHHQPMKIPYPMAVNAYMLKLVFPLLITSAFACKSGSKEEVPAQPKPEQPTVSYNPYEKSEITVDVFKVDSLESNGSGGWGYDILINGKLYIHQPIIPGVQGNRVFSSEEKAREAGELIVSKIRNNILPPSVSVEELDNKGLLE